LITLRRNLLYGLISSCSQVLFPILSIPYVSRVLNPDGIGRVSFIDSLSYYFVIVAELGIMLYGTREVAKAKKDREQLSKLVSELISLHLISSACTLVLYSGAVFALWSRIGDVRLLLFSLSFLVVNSFKCDWYFNGMEKFRFTTMRSLIVRALGLASIYLLIHQPRDYYIYYAIITGSAIVSSIWNNLILFREIHFSFKNINWKKHLQFLWVIYLIGIFYSVPMMLDNVVLRLVNTAYTVGLYAFSVKIVRIGGTLLTDSFLVFFPRIVSLARDSNEQQLQQKLLLNFRFVILLSVPMGFGLFLVSREITHVFLGSKFVSASSNLQILSVYPFLKGIGLFLSNSILVAHHKDKVFLRNLVGSTLLFAIFSFALGTHYGDKGMCLALVLTELSLVCFNFQYVRKAMPAIKTFDLKTLVHAVAGSALFIPFVYFVRRYTHSELDRLIFALAGCFCIYIFFILFIARNSLALEARHHLLKFFTTPKY